MNYSEEYAEFIGGVILSPYSVSKDGKTLIKQLVSGNSVAWSFPSSDMLIRFCYVNKLPISIGCFMNDNEAKEQFESAQADIFLNQE